MTTMHRRWNVITLTVIISLSSAYHHVCYLQRSECGQYTNVTTCEGRVASVVEIDCEFNYTLNQSSSLSYHWWKDGSKLNNISKTIVFDPFIPSDAGSYQCEIHNEYDHVIFCGQIQLKVELIRPTAPEDCTFNGNGNYNCSCRQYIHPIVGCQQLITPHVDGYPTPTIIWLFNETIATNDNQNILAVKDNGSALVDLQLWSMEDNEDKISILARNDLGYVMMCFYPYFLNRYDIKNLHIHFTLSIQSLQLKKGVTNVAVKNCAPDSPIGKFYMCYSKNLTDLEKLEVDAQHCCYCSSEASLDCMKLFPNWNLTDAGSSVFKCYLSLLTITDTDTGYYQCRLSLVETDNDYRNCMLRFGDITKLSVSNPTPSPSPVPNPSPRPADHHSNRNAGHWIHTHVAITCVIVGTIIAGIVAIILVILKVAHHVYMKPTRTSGGYRIHHSSNGDHHEVTAPLMPGPAATAHNHAIQDTNNDDSADHDEGRITQETADTVNNEQGDTRQETSANGHSQLVPSAEGTKRPKVHIMYDDQESTTRWVNDTLKAKLTSMGSELAHKIGGRPWIQEVIRMINEGCKILIIFTKQKMSNQLTTELIFALSKQNINKTAVIPILLDCKLDDLSEEIKSYLSPYTILKHNELDDHLPQSLIA